MKIRLKVFASFCDICGFSEKEFILQEKASVNDLIDILVNEYPSLDRNRSSILVAVNEEYCEKTSIIKDGDIVAIFPPVSGG